MTFILPSFGASAISAVPGGGGGGGAFSNTYSVETDGTNDNIAIGVDPFGNLQGSGNILGITGTSHTICFWMKITGSIPHRVNFFYNSKIQIRTRTDGFRFYSSGTNKHHIHTITAGTWYFLALSCDGTSHTSYVKSASDDLSATVTGNSFTPTGYSTWGPSCNANYDEIATFNSALSASDISNIYNNGVPGNLSGYATLAGHWRMGDSDGGTGTTISDELGGEDAHLRNGPTFSTDVPEAFSNTYSVDFDGTDDYMEIGSSSLTDGLTTLTTSIWFNLSASQNKNIFGSRISNGGINVQIYNNDLYFTIAGDGYLQIDVGATVATNTWHHLAFVFDGSQSASANKIKGYFNGTELTQVANTITGSSITSTTANLLVGSDTLVTNALFNGLIDEFALINSALSSSDITDIYNSGTPADLTSYSPIGWWRMGDNDGGTGTTITDQGSGGNDGTLTNGPTFSTTVPS